MLHLSKQILCIEKIRQLDCCSDIDFFWSENFEHSPKQKYRVHVKPQNNDVNLQLITRIGLNIAFITETEVIGLIRLPGFTLLSPICNFT